MSLDNRKAIAWTIAGSDSGGGAGIQADLHTFQDFDVHGCSVITALTAQNSFAVGYSVATEHKNVVAQINALDSDLPADAIKLGMLANAEIVETVAKYLEDFKGFVVCDPVIQATSGGSLMDDAGSELLKTMLLPRVNLLVPNVPEAEQLSGVSIETSDDMVKAAEQLLVLGCKAVLITGGHFDAVDGQRVDYFTDGSNNFWLAGEDIQTVNSHGSGCTLSSAIAAAIAQGYELWDALVLAKSYVTQGIRAAEQVGGGPGPVAHDGWPMHLDDLPGLHNAVPQTTDGFADCDGELGLYPVVDSVAWVANLLPLGVKTIQLRIKDQPEEAIEQAIEQAIKLAEQHKARLFINDHWQLAIKHKAYGVHLGQEDLDTADLEAIASAGLRLGVSTHSYYEIARAHAVRPSYIAIGPIYETNSKPMNFGPQGVEQLAEWVMLLEQGYPLTAIGGINQERCSEVLATGVASCAMISAITQADDYQAVVKKLLALHDAEESHTCCH
jgi:hydroxymethylpyrimidine kinase/phosphomethylpyrimidine kinase/thiamine-phosphate diphosphorylase